MFQADLSSRSITALDPEYEAIREETSFSFSRFSTFATCDCEIESTPQRVIDAVRSSRFIGLMIPTQYGGRGLDCLARLVNIETAARVFPGLGAALQIAQLGTKAVLEFGTEAQKEALLPEFASGQLICTIAITERDSGSHVKACDTTYRRLNGKLIINGEKWFIGNAPLADMHVVFARDEHTGVFSTILVRSNLPGVSCASRHEMSGLSGFSIGCVSFENVEVSDQEILGAPGDGQRVIHRVVGRHGRLSLTGLALGIHQRVYDQAFEYSQHRELYGKPISALPDIQSKIFDIYQNLEICRSLAYRAATIERDAGDSMRILALSKHVNSRLACQSALTAMQILGARALLKEFEAYQLLLDACMTESPSGTSDVLKYRILEDLFQKRLTKWPDSNRNQNDRYPETQPQKETLA